MNSIERKQNYFSIDSNDHCLRVSAYVGNVTVCLEDYRIDGMPFDIDFSMTAKEAREFAAHLLIVTDEVSGQKN